MTDRATAVLTREPVADRLVALATGESQLVRDNLARHGDGPIADILAPLRTGRPTPLQSPEDLWRAVEEQAAVLYGETTARLAAAELRDDPVVPTSNHFGVDTFADSVQGTLLYALRRGLGPDRPRTVPVLGFGSISMNNLTYPMGLRLYDPRFGDVSGLPQRLPVFPNRVRHCTVAAAGPVDAEMVARARTRLGKMAATGEVTAFCERAAGEILEEEYGSPATLSLPTYGHQSAAINGAMWRRLFAGGAAPSELVQLQIEPLCAALLAADLHDPASLAHMVLLTPEVRDRVVAELDGARACWDLGRLAAAGDGSGAGLHAGGGTLFFWGMTERGRRVPLTLEGGGAGVRLVGVDDRGNRLEWPFTADGILAGLAGGSLLPSLFTCFLVVAFARALVCVGGYYQVEYLPVIQRGVVRALATDADHRRAGEIVAAVPTTSCLAGVQPIARDLGDGTVIPAGPVEIAGGGGLSEADLAHVLDVSVRDAHLVAFGELFDHLVPGAVLPQGWARQLAAENGALHGRIVRVGPA